MRSRTTAVSVVLVMSIVSCGEDSPTPGPTPTTQLTVVSVALNPPTVAVGSTSSGRVTLSAAAPTGGANVTLRSTDPTATVPGSVTVPAGGTTGDFTVTGVAVGTSRIEATYNNATQGTILTVTGAPQQNVSLASLTLASGTIVGGNSVQGTVILATPSPAGGATVMLSSSDQGVAAVPGSVSVPAGAGSATFTVTTRAVGGTIPVTISGSLGGATRTASLNVTAQPLTASFSVSGPNACLVAQDGGSLVCTFDGSASTGNNLNQWRWTWTVAGRTQSTNTPGPRLESPTTGGCSLFAGVTTRTSPNPIQMTVTLQVVQSGGDASAPVTNNNVFVTPRSGVCGFARF